MIESLEGGACYSGSVIERQHLWSATSSLVRPVTLLRV